MSGDLWLLMVSHFDGERRRQRCDAAPFRWSAAPAGVEIADIDGARRHQVATACATYLALACADWDAGLIACGGQVETIIIPTHRLFEPTDVEIGCEAREFDGLAKRPTLVGVDDQDEGL